MGLTPRQQKFVDAFDGDATAAARAAGYTGNNLSVRGSRLLKDPEVRAALALREGNLAQPPPSRGKVTGKPPAEASIEQLVEHVVAVREGKAEPLHLVPPLPAVAPDIITPMRVANRMRRQAFWSSVMEDKLADMSDRLKASELLAKSEADFVARVAHEGMVIEVVDPYARPPAELERSATTSEAPVDAEVAG